MTRHAINYDTHEYLCGSTHGEMADFNIDTTCADCADSIRDGGPGGHAIPESDIISDKLLRITSRSRRRIMCDLAQILNTPTRGDPSLHNTDPIAAWIATPSEEIEKISEVVRLLSEAIANCRDNFYTVQAALEVVADNMTHVLDS